MNVHEPEKICRYFKCHSSIENSENLLRFVKVNILGNDGLWLRLTLDLTFQTSLKRNAKIAVFVVVTARRKRSS